MYMHKADNYNKLKKIVTLYLEPVEHVALCADAGDDAGGKNEKLHHLQGLLLSSATRTGNCCGSARKPQVVTSGTDV